ncbi:hypothetical protein AB4144_61585, partial [Rhizobiaceae sp. 2RAB30]
MASAEPASPPDATPAAQSQDDSDPATAASQPLAIQAEPAPPLTPDMMDDISTAAISPDEPVAEA